MHLKNCSCCVWKPPCFNFFLYLCFLLCFAKTDFLGWRSWNKAKALFLKSILVNIFSGTFFLQVQALAHIHKNTLFKGIPKILKSQIWSPTNIWTTVAKHFEFTHIFLSLGYMAWSQTLKTKPMDLNSYWSENTDRMKLQAVKKQPALLSWS